MPTFTVLSGPSPFTDIMIIPESKQLPLPPTAVSQPDAFSAPPAYTRDLTTSPNPSTPSSIPPLAPHNYVRIEREHNSINETLVIDASLPGEGKNLFLQSLYSSVTAKVYLVGTIREMEKVDMELNSSHSAVKFELCHRDRGLPIRLAASSPHNSITVALPPDFRGPLTITTKHGSVKIQPSLARRLRTFTEIDGVRRCWVGEPARDGEDDWRFDECTLGSTHGSVKVGFWEDKPAYEAKQGGGFKSLFKVFS